MILLYQDFLIQYKNAREMINDFKSRDPEIDDFLKNRADSVIKHGEGQPYVIIENNCIAGFFSIVVVGASRLSFPLSNKMRKSTERYIDNNGMDRYVVMLLGQFAKDKEKSINSGGDMLDEVLDYITIICRPMNIQYIIVQCKKIDALLNFYINHNFVLYEREDSEYYNLAYKMDFTYVVDNE